MSDIDALLQAQSAGAQVGSIDSMLSAQAGGKMSAPIASPAAPVTKGQSVGQGLGDTEFGLGQLAEHVPILSTITKGWRELLQEGFKAAGFNNVSDALGNNSDPTSGDITDKKGAQRFDGIVQQRENDYQDARQAAGQTGIDWWRLGGQAANPINYMAPEGAGASMGARIGQGAVQGAVLGAEQPSQSPGSFWWDKAKGMLGGSLGGGAAAGLVETISPVLKVGVGLAKKYLGAAAPDTAAAESVVNDALRAKGVDPDSMDLNLLSGMKHEVQDALKSGADDISPESIVNRAKAESLPVPVRLMRGQATGDPMLYSTEQNLRGVTGVGEPITQRLQEQNAAFIQNLDALGAKDAPDTVSASNMIADKSQSFWDSADAQKKQLYDAVKNTQGLSAMVDGVSAAKSIREQLGSPDAGGAWYAIQRNAPEIPDMLKDLEDGMPFTVSNLQALDKSWGQLAARAPNGTVSNAINQAREILGNADIDEDIGQDAMQAYTLAKQAHAKQMSMVTPKLLNDRPNPNYQPLLDAVVYGGKRDDVFTKGFMGASPSDAAKNLAFLKQVDPEMEPLVGKTLMGEIKRQALSSASDERGTVSQSVLAGWARDPVKSARLEALMPDSAVQTFKNLADTVEVAKRFPVASTVNTSNTGSAVINAAASALKNNAVTQIAKRVKPVSWLVDPVTEGLKANAESKAVQGALNPGVTLKSLLTASPSQAVTRRTLSRLVIPGAVAAEQSDSTPPQ